MPLSKRRGWLRTSPDVGASEFVAQLLIAAPQTPGPDNRSRQPRLAEGEDGEAGADSEQHPAKPAGGQQNTACPPGQAERRGETEAECHRQTGEQGGSLARLAESPP